MELKILNLNIMVDGTSVDDPVTVLAQIISNSEADIVIFTESNSATLLKNIFSKIGNKNKWAAGRAGSSAVLSQMPIGVLDEQQKSVITVAVGDVADHGRSGPAFNGGDGITVLVDVTKSGSFGKNSLIVSGVHPDYRNYACYLPRGYDGVTWKALPGGPVTDVQKIKESNQKSGRQEQIKQTLKTVEKYEAIYNKINMTSLIGGDFNEPSGIDWSEGRKNYFGHHGVVYDWDATRLLRENGYIDTFHIARLKKCGLTEKSPQNEIDKCIIKHPGVTWQSLPPKNKQGHWADKTDDRDRIDFIFTRPSDTIKMEIKNSVIVGDNYYYGYYGGQTTGTSECKLDEPSNGTVDDFLTLGYPKPNGEHFPSDHRGVLTTVDLSVPFCCNQCAVL